MLSCWRTLTHTDPHHTPRCAQMHTQMHMDAHGCTWMHMDAHKCTHIPRAATHHIQGWQGCASPISGGWRGQQGRVRRVHWHQDRCGASTSCRHRRRGDGGWGRHRQYLRGWWGWRPCRQRGCSSGLGRGRHRVDGGRRCWYWCVTNRSCGVFLPPSYFHLLLFLLLLLLLPAAIAAWSSLAMPCVFLCTLLYVVW